MLICFHKSYLDEFSTNVNIVSLVHKQYFMNVKLFLMDLIMNAPLEIVILATSLTSLQKVILISYCRLNRVLRIFRMISLFHSWEIDIRRK